MNLLKARFGARGAAGQTVANLIGLLPEESPWIECFPGISPFRQFPLDVNHSELKGMCSRYLDLLLDQVLNAQGQVMYRQALTVFENPPGWQAFQNPIVHRKSYGFTELGRLIIVTPFLMESSISILGIRAQAVAILTKLSAESGLPGQPLVFLVQMYARMADHVARCLSTSLSTSQIRAIGESAISIRRAFQGMTPCYHKLDKGRNLITKDADSLSKLPNVHIGLHVEEVAMRYGNLVNVCTTSGEEKHKETKRNVSFISPGQDPIKQLMQKIQIQRGLTNAAQASVNDTSYLANLIRKLRETHPKMAAHSFPAVQQAQCVDPIVYPNTGIIDVDSAEVIVRGQWDTETVRMRGFDCSFIGGEKARLLDFYSQMGLVVGDVGKSRLQFWKTATFIENGRRRQVKVGQTFWHPGDGKLVVVVGLCQHMLGKKATTMLYCQQYEKVGRSDLLQLGIYHLQDTWEAALNNSCPQGAREAAMHKLRPLGYLHGANAAHMVPIKSRDGVELRFVREYYRNKWWVPFH